MIRAAILIPLSVLTLLSCGERAPPAPIVVYAVGEDEATLTKLLEQFTDDTRIPVTLVFSKSSRNADLVINNSGSPPADVLITNSVADIWRAADEGAMMPIKADTFDRADPLLSDPDGFWTSLAVRLHVIATSKEKTASRPMPASYDWLADEDRRGRVCLSSSALHANRSLLAMLIHKRGVKQTERLVRAWIRNLAAPPFSSENELLSAIRDGVCEYGILSEHPLVDDLRFIVPEQQTMDIDGIGVARHARQADSAQHLVEWLVRNKQPRIDHNSDISPVSIAGWLDEDARLLAERAGYQ
jgi:iron(III) transport system substrate-binding protein